MDRHFKYARVTRSIDAVSLAVLVKLCFKMDVDHEYFNWKYFDNPAGEVVAYVAVHDDKIVAFYGVIPELYWVNGEIVKIYQSMDTMTHPDFRRQGLFAKLAKMCYHDIAKENSDYLILGFPAPASHAGFVQKLGWSTVFSDKFWFCYSLLFKTISWSVNFSNDLSFEPLNMEAPDVFHYFERKKPLLTIEKFLNAEIFVWKILKNKHKKYEQLGIFKNNALIGLVVYYLDTPKSCQLLWIDFLNKSDFEFKTLGNVMNHLFSLTQRRCIYIWGPLSRFQQQAFRRIGFLTNPFARGPFHSTLPFITLANVENRIHPLWENKENYNFQGLMLD